MSKNLRQTQKNAKNHVQNLIKNPKSESYMHWYLSFSIWNLILSILHAIDFPSHHAPTHREKDTFLY